MDIVGRLLAVGVFVRAGNGEGVFVGSSTIMAGEEATVGISADVISPENGTSVNDTGAPTFDAKPESTCASVGNSAAIVSVVVVEAGSELLHARRLAKIIAQNRIRVKRLIAVNPICLPLLIICLTGSRTSADIEWKINLLLFYKMLDTAGDFIQLDRLQKVAVCTGFAGNRHIRAGFVSR